MNTTLRLHGFALAFALVWTACGEEDDPNPAATPDASVADSSVPDALRDAGGAGPGPAVRDAAIVPGDTGVVSSFDAGSTPERNVVTAGAVCERFATLQCAAEQACCSNAGRTIDACKTAQLAVCRGTGHVDEASMLAVSAFDPARAKAQFEVYETLATRCDPQATAWVTEATGFRGVFLGTLNTGESCAPGLFELSEATAAGYALACKDPATTACLPDSAAWLCVARGGVGTRCFTDANCIGDTYCSNTMPGLTTLGGNTTCLARKPVGQPCIGSGECASLACVGKQCVPMTVDAAYCFGR